MTANLCRVVGALLLLGVAAAFLFAIPSCQVAGSPVAAGAFAWLLFKEAAPWGGAGLVLLALATALDHLGLVARRLKSVEEKLDVSVQDGAEVDRKPAAWHTVKRLVEIRDELRKLNAEPGPVANSADLPPHGEGSP